MSRRGSDESIGKERKRRGRHLDDDKDSSLYQDIDDASIRLQSDNEGNFITLCLRSIAYQTIDSIRFNAERFLTCNVALKLHHMLRF